MSGHSSTLTTEKKLYNAEDADRIRTMDLMLKFTLAVSNVFGLILVIGSPTPGISLVSLLAMNAMVLAGLFAIRRGQANITGHIYTLSSWFIITCVAIFVHGGINSPILETYILVIALSGLLLGGPAAILYAVLSLVSVAGIYLAQVNNLLPPGSIPLNAERYLIFHALSYSLAGFLIWIVYRSVQVNITRLQKNERELVEKNQELQEVRSSLEERISQRTGEILRQKQYYESLVANSPVAIVSLDLEHRIVACNPAFETLFGYSQTEIIGMNLDDLITDETLREEATGYSSRVRQGKTLHRTGKRRSKNGILIDVEISGVPVIVSGEQVGILGLYQDITERRRNEAHLQHLATHDPLTVLPNRSLFYDRLSTALRFVELSYHLVAVMFLDLDGFKVVNDTFGHELGDLLLQEVADRFSRTLRKADTVARLGGDEFGFIFNTLNQSEDAARIAEKILQTLAEPMSVNGNTCRITASIGISLAPQDGITPDGLLKNADEAMYRAKEQGRNTYRFFSASPGSDAGRTSDADITSDAGRTCAVDRETETGRRGDAGPEEGF